MRPSCPKCDVDLYQTVYNLEIRDCSTTEKFDCPNCGTKLEASVECEYCVVEDETPSNEAKENKTKEGV